ncbi:unnamed protein product, partial [Ectocarpus sp. 12 AP-2014]
PSRFFSTKNSLATVIESPFIDKRTVDRVTAHHSSSNSRKYRCAACRKKCTRTHVPLRVKTFGGDVHSRIGTCNSVAGHTCRCEPFPQLTASFVVQTLNTAQ